MEPHTQGPSFLDREQLIIVSGSKLPHWEQMGACYFVTIRLADSVPLELWRQFDMERQTWLALHPKPWDEKIEAEFHTRFSGQMEEWLDQGMGSCVLRDPACAAQVGAALQFFEKQRVAMLSYVVMPNHAHALFQPLQGHSLAELLHLWKRHSAREINRHLGRTGALWQANYFDRLIRDWTHFGRVVKYIRQNPMKANLGEGAYLLWEADWVRTSWPQDDGD